MVRLAYKKSLSMGEAISSVCFFGVGFVWLSYGFEYFAAAQFWSASGMFICCVF